MQGAAAHSSNHAKEKTVFQKFGIRTDAREEILDITASVRDFVKKNVSASAPDALLYLFCRHTTCGLTINESADPAVKRDLIRFFRKIAPQTGWEHAEGNTDAHIRSSLLGVSLLVPIENGDLRLGTWQAIYFYEGDGPRTRDILAKILPLAQ